MPKREVKVKEYKDAKEFDKDAQKMVKDGWVLDQQSQGSTHMNVGRTLFTTAVTGGLNMLAPKIGGGSYSKGKITATWVKETLGAQEAQEAAVSRYLEGLAAQAAEPSGFFDKMKDQQRLQAYLPKDMATRAKVLMEVGRMEKDAKARGLPWPPRPTAPALMQADEPERVPCPECAELIMPAAKVCRFCGYRQAETGPV